MKPKQVDWLCVEVPRFLRCGGTQPRSDLSEFDECVERFLDVGDSQAGNLFLFRIHYADLCYTCLDIYVDHLKYFFVIVLVL